MESKKTDDKDIAAPVDHLDVFLAQVDSDEEPILEENVRLSREPNVAIHHMRNNAVDFTAQLQDNPDLFLLDDVDDEEANHLITLANTVDEHSNAMSVADIEATLFEPRPAEYFTYLRQRGVSEFEIKEQADAQYRAQERRMQEEAERLSQLEGANTLLEIRNMHIASENTLPEENKHSLNKFKR